MQYSDFKHRIITSLNRCTTTENTGYRTKPNCIKAYKYLSPAVHNLPEDVISAKIAQEYDFSLKNRTQIPADQRDQYDGLFGTGFENASVFGNSAFICNLLRGFYDLSLRYTPPQLTAQCTDLAYAYTSCLVTNNDENFLPLVNNYFSPFIELIATHFYITDTTKSVLERSMKQGIDESKRSAFSPSLQITARHRVLEDFIYLAPNPDLIEAQMQDFHAEYEIRLASTNEENLIDNAAWIIHKFCIIHPFQDGNGKVARQLCFDFLSQHYSNLVFTPEEVTIFGEDPDYQAATSRSEKPGGLSRISDWLTSLVESKLSLSHPMP